LLTTKAIWKRKVVRVLLTLLTLYLLLVVVIYFYQRKLIYFPTQLSPKLAVTMAERAGFTPWTNKSGQVIGWKFSATNIATGSVLIVHGNAGCAIDRTYLAKPIHEAASVDVYILEYPSYGAREGSASQQNLFAAAGEAFDLLTNNASIYIVSESLGTGVAAHLAETYGSKVSGLILLAPYDKFVSVAQDKMPIFPVSLILRDRFNPTESLKNYSGPIKFVVAEKDEIIAAKFGLRLHESFAGPKILEVIAGAHHNEVASQPSSWWKDVFSFWQENRSKD